MPEDSITTEYGAAAPQARGIPTYVGMPPRNSPVSTPPLPTPPDLSGVVTPSPPPPAEQLAELSALTGGLAHEIRNPLSTLRMNLQLLDEDWTQVASPRPGKPVDAAEVARRSRRRIATLLAESDHLERILEDFLLFVSRRELHPVETDLNELVGDLVDFFQPQAQAHKINLRVGPSSQPLLCKIDPHLIKQAVFNLLINAQQAMPQGGEIYLLLGLHGDDFARLDVIDTGPGIPEDQRARIFDAYFSTKRGGTGLGLPTTRKIVQEHGGRVHVYSDPPNGSCFTILLPRA